MSARSDIAGMSQLRSGTDAGTPSKRRSRFIMKIIPSFGVSKDTHTSPAHSPSHNRPFNTFPRARPTTELEEPVETLATQFSVIAWQQNTLSPPSSASSYNTTFSSSQGGGSSTATSPETTLGDLPSNLGHHSWSKKDGSKLKPATSRESMRTFFSHQHTVSSSSIQTLSQSAISQQGSDEADWEKTLEEAATRASWQSSISHRPRSKHRYAPSVQSQRTWPRLVSNSSQQRDGLQLEHVFVDAFDDGASSSYASSAYSGYPLDNESSSSLPMGKNVSSSSLASSSFQGPHSYQQQRGPSSPLVCATYASTSAVPSISISSAAKGGESSRREFDTLPRASKGRVQRPSTTGSSVRGEPVEFGLRVAAPFGASLLTAGPASRSSASLGRATSKGRSPYLDHNVIGMKGRRRSLDRLEGSSPSSLATVPIVVDKMPTISQGHSRETSLADDEDDDQRRNCHTLNDGEFALASFPSASNLGSAGRKISIAASDYSDEGGDFIPLRLGSIGNCTSSQDRHGVTASLNVIGNSVIRASQRPIKFDLTSFGTVPIDSKDSTATDSRHLSPHITPRTSSVLSASLERRFSRFGVIPDVPETASEAEDADLLDCDYDISGRRRRSTFSVSDPIITLSAATASPPRQTIMLA